MIYKTDDPLVPERARARMTRRRKATILLVSAAAVALAVLLFNHAEQQSTRAELQQIGTQQQELIDAYLGEDR